MEDATGTLPLEILLVDDDGNDAELFARMLRRAEPTGFHVERVCGLAKAIERQRQKPADVILLDLGLPDAEGGVETFRSLRRAVPTVPVLVLTGASDEDAGAQAVRLGAQDYLFKDEVAPPLLRRAIRYAIERHRLQEEIRALSLRDELTGLLNRRGFLTLSAEALRRAPRRSETFLLFFADLDELKSINDRFGHEAGDQAIRDVATALKRAFREADLLARIGGDEFAVLAPGAAGAVPTLLGRIEEQARNVAAETGRPFPLSISVGCAVCAAAECDSVERLIERADARMYETKRARHRAEHPAAGSWKSGEGGS